jgi:hypothetical protein
LVLDVQNQFAVPKESVKRIGPVPLIGGEPLAATGANVGVQAAPSVGGRSPHSPPARDAYRASPQAPARAARPATQTSQAKSERDAKRQEKLERIRQKRLDNVSNRRRGRRGGGRDGRMPLPATTVSDSPPGL